MVRILMHRPHSVSGINQQTNFFHPLLKMRWACKHLLFRSMQKYQNSLIHSLSSDPALQVFIAVLFVEAEMFVTSRRTGLLISITFVHLQKQVPFMSVQEQVLWLWYKKTRKYFEFSMPEIKRLVMFWNLKSRTKKCKDPLKTWGHLGNWGEEEIKVSEVCFCLRGFFSSALPQLVLRALK